MVVWVGAGYNWFGLLFCDDSWTQPTARTKSPHLIVVLSAMTRQRNFSARETARWSLIPVRFSRA